MIIPQRTDPIWAEIVSGKKEIVFEFFAVKIFLGFARFKLKSSPSNLSQLANELYNIFERNQGMPSVQKDLKKFNKIDDGLRSHMTSVAEAALLVKSGKAFLVAGNEELLRQIPPGNWIGGTIPYFIAPEGGIVSEDRVLVTEFPDYIQSIEIHAYDETDIGNIYIDTPREGFSFLILPATSPVHLSFALNAPRYQSFGVSPVVGWVSGVHLSDLGTKSPKVINGLTGELSDKKAMVMRCTLSPGMVCEMDIVNIFSQGNGDTIEVLEDGFAVKEVLVNGNRVNFVDYVLERNLDLKLPLVANYCGANINVSFQAVDKENHSVSFYAPLFKGIQYRQAVPISNYVEDFLKQVPRDDGNILFCCNCILNFIYSEFEGKTSCGIVGPVTFGEIAYQLLNQTMVYLTVHRKDFQVKVVKDALEKQLEERTEELKRCQEELAISEMELYKMLSKIESAFKELKQTQEKLLQVEKMATVGQLAAGVAHEINNPAAFVMGNLSVVQEYIDKISGLFKEYAQVEAYLEGLKTEQSMQMLDALAEYRENNHVEAIIADFPHLLKQSLDGMSRIKTIVTNLKNFSHTDEGYWEDADIHEIIQSALDIAWNDIKFKAEVVTQYGDISRIYCFPQQLSQVFLNLFVNAVHAIQENGKITIRTSMEEDAVVIQITDTGAGMTEEVRRRIFEPFFTTKPVGKGTGLGLSLVYTIIEKHKGEISVDSVPGQGTTFTVRLPRGI
ncbi:MAG: ATP-binding protein [Candidatus Omnitrophota bacterium]